MTWFQVQKLVKESKKWMTGDPVMSLKIYDSHTHLNDDAFYDDVPAFIARARHFGVLEMNMVGSNRVLNDRAIRLAEHYSGLHAVIGWHPEDAKDLSNQEWCNFLKQVDNNEVVGIGEIGLDYHWDTSPVQVQKAVFGRQLKLASKLKLPVSVHCREALEDTYQILKENHVGDFGGVMHSFAGDAEWAKKFLDLGMDLSYSGVVSFNSAQDVQAAAQVTPLDRIMVETDAPYLTPVPYRGKKNEPAFTYFTVLALAKLKGVSPEDVATASYDNAKRMFKERITNEKN